MLHTIAHGTPGRLPPVLIAHGLFGTARNWGGISKRLARTRQVLTVDMRNHGDSPRADSQSYEDMAADLAEVVEAHGGRADVVGHSMGGKAAMAMALHHPETVRRMVVADIAPVAYGHTQQPMIDAMRAVDLSRAETRRDADAQMADMVSDPGVRAFLLRSLDVAGRAWRLNLDVLEAYMDQLIGWPEITGEVFDGPVLFLTGAQSDYVRPDHRPAIKALFPNAKFAKLPGAGHWLHVDKPREFEAVLESFLNHAT